ncbi:hypothetical protein G9A89_023232 [Geosiphon pyriformis]|nr:hypothetical protein G9A89_023232 [Geosiphon pyriformis]
MNCKMISGNAHHFIRTTNDTVRCFQWKFGPGLSIVDPSWVGNINWVYIVSVWYPDSHMSAKYTSKTTVSLCIYLMKALHGRLFVAITYMIEVILVCYVYIAKK